MASRQQCLDYWAGRLNGQENGPDSYAAPSPRREAYVVSIFERYVPDHQMRVIELGCNCGRNLLALQEAGYDRLSGVDCNALAVAEAKRRFPQLNADLCVSTFEDFAPKLPEAAPEVIFTVAALEHLHWERQEDVFDAMARCARIIVTVEDEVGYTWRHFPRNYAGIFVPRGMVQVFAERCPKVDNDIAFGFFARVFYAQGAADA